MRLYAGIDLHSSNSYLAVIDETGKRVFKKKLPNDPEQIFSALAPYKDANIGIVVESTCRRQLIRDYRQLPGLP